MKAELEKIRTLWVFKIVALTLIGCQLLLLLFFVFKPSSNGDNYIQGPFTVTMFIGGICAVVAGMAVIGVEYSQKTLQRTLCAKPQRGRVLMAKLLLANLFVVVCFASIFFVFATVDVHLLGASKSFESGKPSIADLLAYACNAAIWLAVATTVGFGLTLLTRSSAAGVSLSLAWMFIVDSVLQAFSGVKSYSFGSSVQRVLELVSSPVSDGGVDISLAHGVIQLAVYLGIILLPGWLRFVRGDLG